MLMKLIATTDLVFPFILPVGLTFSESIVHLQMALSILGMMNVLNSSNTQQHWYRD